MKKNIILIGAILFISCKIFAQLPVGRWTPENREKLQALVEKNKNEKNYVVFDWDYTSIYQDTQENLFRYQIDNLKFNMTPEEFNKAIRKDIPKNDFSDEYVNKNGEKLNIDKLAADLDKDYAYLYKNYIKNQKEPLEKIKKSEEFIDFRAKLAFLYEAIGGSFSHDIAYPWVLYLFTGMTSDEIQKLAKEANDFGIGNRLGNYTLESSDKLKGKAGKIVYTYKSGLRTQPEIANLFYYFKDNGIDVYVVSASLEDVVEVFATDPSYGYNLEPENVFGMRLEKQGNKYITEYKKGYPQTQTKGKVEIINEFIKPNYDNKDPLLVAGDSIGDYNMLTEFKGTKNLLLMKREGKLDDLVKDERAIIQKRNSQTGLFIPNQN
ncbi:haloacid dehalogenase-like hydrolase (plasmid) [Cetobacterium somerae]|uniref:haloacid dehalogenase-like hydrolase n=1 Tax=Cetobacterium somerae TaxID=188913 RepID=UPI0038916865